MTLAYPWLAIAGVVLALVAGGGVVRRARRERSLVKALGGRVAGERLSVHVLGRVRWARVVLLVMASLTLATAVADPRFRGQDEAAEVPTTAGDLGVHVMLAIDVSTSMQAAHGSSTRLGAAVQLARQVLDTVAQARVGLLLFAGEAYPLVPPTDDHRSVTYMLQGVSPTTGSPWDSGSRISSAIRESAVYLRGGEDPEELAILILVSDGAVEEGELEVMEAVSDAVETGVVIHVIGLGGETAATGEALLRRVAGLSGGTYGQGTLPAGLEGLFRIPPVDLGPSRPAFEGAQWDVALWLAGLAFLFMYADGLLDARLPSWGRFGVRGSR